MLILNQTNCEKIDTVAYTMAATQDRSIAVDLIRELMSHQLMQPIKPEVAAVLGAGGVIIQEKQG